MSKRTISIYENILSVNDKTARENFEYLSRLNIFSINIMASPGAGKTSLIERTIQLLLPEIRIAVIDGDIATSFDADRATAAGARAIQINTGGDCHLDATMVQNALKEIDLKDIDLLIVENVGNLVCPASFQLGTHKNVLIASIPEGDDKPYKYPAMYRGIQTLVLNKIDLLPYTTFNVSHFYKGVEILNPGIEIFPVSCHTQEGLEHWVSWVKQQILR